MKLFDPNRWSTGAVVVGAVLSVAAPCLADNPIVQTNYTADPAPVVFDGTLYLYTTHDEDQTVDDFFTMNDWRVYSTTDVVNWTDHGSPLHYRDFSWAGGSAWAGQVTVRDGKYYFYVPVVRSNGGNAIGVAVADSPIGPFEDAIGQPLITSDCGDIDPTVFIDDDGQAYLYWGNPNLCYVLLNDDMVSYQGDVVHVPMTTASLGTRNGSDRPVAYEEGPWFYGRDGTYYMVYPGGPLPEHIAYSTSPGPTGPWTYGGVIMPAEGASFTNHPGVVDYKGKSLFFYHNGALPGGGGYKRSVCVEEFEYGADGGMPELRMTSEGASAVDVLNPFARTEAETIARESGIETEVSSEGGMNVTDIDDGDFIQLKDVEFGSGATSFEVQVAASSAGGSIELRLDAENGTLVGTCDVESTGNDMTWVSQSCTVDGATGKHDLFLKFTGGGFKFDWWRFAGPGDPGSSGAGGQGGSAGGSDPGPIGGSAAIGGGGVMSGTAGVASGGASSGGSMASSGVGGDAASPQTPGGPVEPTGSGTPSPVSTTGPTGTVVPAGTTTTPMTNPGPSVGPAAGVDPSPSVNPSTSVSPDSSMGFAGSAGVQGLGTDPSASQGGCSLVQSTWRWNAAGARYVAFLLVALCLFNRRRCR